MSAGPRRARLRSGGTAVLARTLRPVLDVAGVATGVSDVLDAVRERGDDALVEGARRFDCPDFTHDRLRVPEATLARAAASMDEDLRTAIGVAAAQVRAGGRGHAAAGPRASACPPARASPSARSRSTPPAATCRAAAPRTPRA